MDKRIEEKIDKIIEIQTDMKVTLAGQAVTLTSQHEDLQEHMRRTNLLEAQIKPIEKHVHMMQGAMKFLGAVAVVVGIIEGILKLLGK